MKPTNSKSEARNSKQAQMPKIQMLETAEKTPHFEFDASNLFRASDLGFRIWNYGASSF
jgi:hypothetical protein